MKLKIGIIGTRGIPNHYGGFEHVAEHVSQGLVARGHDVTVYNSHNHPYREQWLNGVRIRHCYDPEYLLGTAGQFVYDLNCVLDARSQHFDVLLFMGYTSSSVWGALYPKNAVIISNMDGLEWRREKYSRPVRKFLRKAEALAVKYSHHYIADSTVIRSYLAEKYGIDSRYIPYGADPLAACQPEAFGEADRAHYLLMARMEPENNIQTILEGFHASASTRSFRVIGNTANRFGKFIAARFVRDERIIFDGANFDSQEVSRLQACARLYFHGHSVGGTNPSLLTAMANGALIAAHNNPFNRAVLQSDAFYFSTADDVRGLVQQTENTRLDAAMVQNNLRKIAQEFNWERVVAQHEEFIIDCYLRTHGKRK